ncbi:hypothetical protein IV203_004598 [Nitzschia inconspicua]|uniref:DUF6824 domain-containing protein n=1 Tax=Nitzschia inconspicua TaxID=303405 RepID=A0A9K3PPU5_9STRA|nr:hypothetical protein IV203_004598 [Nitzschia inconspicua]
MIFIPSRWRHPSMTCRRESSLKKNENRVHLGSIYIPGHNAVICGRGKACTSSPGNKKLRAYIDSFATSYGAARNKEQKSKIVSTIISLIEEPEGGAFVKFEESTWWKVDEAYAREKIGVLFRDVLHTKYRSSSKAKQARKKMPIDGTCRFNDEIQSTANKLLMDQSYSSCCSSSASTTCRSNNRKSVFYMDLSYNHIVSRPSLVDFPAMSSMVFGTGNCYSNSIYPMPQPPLERRKMLSNYCNYALTNTCSDADKNIFNTAVVPFTASFQNMAAMVMSDNNNGSSFTREFSKTSSMVSEEGDGMEKDDHDKMPVFTLVEDDHGIIFSNFLVENAEDLSRILLDK